MQSTIEQKKRDIKFRAWDKANKQMIVSKQGISTIVARRLRGGAPEGHLNGNGSVEDADFELMQYTGLKDKNDKDIYEGDIVMHYNNPFVIEWWKSGFSMKSLGELTNRFQLRTTAKNKMEVIGNIYENPELL